MHPSESRAWWNQDSTVTLGVRSWKVKPALAQRKISRRGNLFFLDLKCRTARDSVKIDNNVNSSSYAGRRKYLENKPSDTRATLVYRVHLRNVYHRVSKPCDILTRTGSFVKALIYTITHPNTSGCNAPWRASSCFRSSLVWWVSAFVRNSEIQSKRILPP